MKPKAGGNRRRKNQIKSSLLYIKPLPMSPKKLKVRFGNSCTWPTINERLEARYASHKEALEQCRCELIHYDE